MKDYKQALKIPISPLLIIVRESNLQYIFECVMNLLNVMTLRNSKVQDKETKSF